MKCNSCREDFPYASPAPEPWYCHGCNSWLDIRPADKEPETVKTPKINATHQVGQVWEIQAAGVPVPILFKITQLPSAKDPDFYIGSVLGTDGLWTASGHEADYRLLKKRRPEYE